MAAARSTEDISETLQERPSKATTPQYERPPPKKAREDRLVEMFTLVKNLLAPLDDS